MKQDAETEMLKEYAEQEYKYGFVTNIESDTLPPGLNEDVIKFISKKKDEPEWLTEWRLKAYKIWKKWKNHIGLMWIILLLIINLLVIIQPQKICLMGRKV